MFYKIFVLIWLNLVCLSFGSFNIDDFGGKSDDPSYQTALANGKAFNDAIIAANSSSKDRTVVVSQGKNYTILPHGQIVNLFNLTIQIDGILFAWHDNVVDWPIGEFWISYHKENRKSTNIYMN